MRIRKRGDYLYVPDHLQCKSLLKQLHFMASKIIETLIKCKKKLIPKWVNEMHVLLLIYAPVLCILTILLKELPYQEKRQP